MSQRESFLNELKLQYDKEFELKDTLESKANYLLTAAGIVVTLLFSFGSLIIDKLDQHSQIFLSVDILLLVSICANVLTILFSVLAFKITLYMYSMPSDNFYDKDGNLNEKSIAEYRDGEDIETFYNTIIDTYLDCNRHNDSMNAKKANKIKIAQWSFFAAIIVIPIIIGIITFS